MARKGQFKKGGGRVGDGRKYAKRSSHVAGSGKARPSGGALVVVDQYAMTGRRASAPRKRRGGGGGGGGGHMAHHAPRRRRRGGGGGGVTWKKAVMSAIVLSNVAGTNTGLLGARVYDLVQKVPGAKTFGGAATAGLILGAAEKWGHLGGRFRPWLRAAGLVGVVLAGAKVGEAGTKFAWLGEPEPRQRMGGDRFMDVDTD